MAKLGRMNPSAFIPVNGINIQYPWSELIVSGKKLIETRSYSLPKKHLNQPLAVIQTPGVEGKLHGILKAHIVGIVIFSGSKRYESFSHWHRDFGLHLVPGAHPQFAYREGVPKWGWSISYAVKFKKPLPAKNPRGIIFARNCLVPLSYLRDAPQTPELSPSSTLSQ